MDTGTSHPPSTNPPQAARPETTAVLAWPVAVQISVVLIVTACLFFLIGRWSLGWSSPENRVEANGPALDLNRATKAELRLVPGLGDTLSQRVLDHRERIGPFRNIDDLLQVHGIGPKTLERMRPHVFVSANAPPMERFQSGMMPSQNIAAAMTRSKKESLLTSAINVNSADQTELQKLPGIGPKLSQRILDERARARFKSIDDLRRVSGIGPKTLEKLRPHVTIE